MKHKACAWSPTTYLSEARIAASFRDVFLDSSILVTGGAGFIGSNLVLTLQERMPEARLTVIDDFRSGDFKNLAGYRGDFVAQNLATLDWRQQFGDEKFDAIFHLASITDTTLHDQFVQVHDNVESFRRLLNFAKPQSDARRLCLIRSNLRRRQRGERGNERGGARQRLRIFESDHG